MTNDNTPRIKAADEKFFSRNSRAIYCPYCKKQHGYVNPRAYGYGRPLITCNKCNAIFRNPYLHELAIEPASPDSHDISLRIKWILITGGIFALSFAFYIVSKTVFSFSRFSSSLYLVILSFALMLAGLIDIILIKTGVKDKQLEKKRQESIERLKDQKYAQLLVEAGYNVPAVFLQEGTDYNQVNNDNGRKI